MTNEQIIEGIAIQLYGVEEVKRLLEENMEIPLHTVQGWTARNYRVKKGEHAVAVTKLWKRKKNEPEEVIEDEEHQFFLAPAYLFEASQVERIDD